MPATFRHAPNPRGTTTANLRLARRLLPLLCLLLTACTTNTGNPPSGSRNAINELNLLGLPVAVNLDERPGADGVAVKIFAVNRAKPRAQPIRSGTLEIAAYPGTPSLSALPPPFHLWTFTPTELAPFEFTTGLGTGYNLVLSWVPKLLAADRVTVIARYLPAEGNPVISAPNSITAAAY